MSRQARVGFLVLGGFLLFVLTLFLLANQSFLLSNTFTVRARFDRVAQLQSGAAVSYQGVTVGRVQSVQLPDRPGGQIEVAMQISERAHHLVREGTQAQIKSEGLVGNQMVVLVGGSTTAAVVEDDGYIQGINPFDLFAISDQALATVAKFDTAATQLNMMMADVRAGQGTIGRFIYDPAAYNGLLRTMNQADAFMRNLAVEADRLVAVAQDASNGMNAVIQKVNTGEGLLARLLNDPGLYTNLLATNDTLIAMAGNMRRVMEHAETATQWAALGTFRFAENMEALKHNILFKGYFENRGYYEKAPFEQREAAIEASFQELQRQKRELLAWEERLRAQEDRLTRLIGQVDSLRTQR